MGGTLAIRHRCACLGLVLGGLNRQPAALGPVLAAAVAGPSLVMRAPLLCCAHRERLAHTVREHTRAHVLVLGVVVTVREGRAHPIHRLPSPGRNPFASCVRVCREVACGVRFASAVAGLGLRRRLPLCVTARGQGCSRAVVERTRRGQLVLLVEVAHGQRAAFAVVMGARCCGHPLPGAMLL